MLLTDQLRADLRTAMKQRDGRAVTVLRTALAAIAIANAEAVDPADHHADATEVPRRELTEHDVQALLDAELAEMRAVAGDLQQRGRTDDAADLEARIAVLAAYVGPRAS